MTDRELLEWAAKAAGIKVPGKEHWPWEYIDDKGIHRDISSGGDGSRMNHWNPLTDDADAFRLMVKLGIVVEYRREVPACFAYHYNLGIEVMQRNDQLDPPAVTRRAIVRAAAEIGSKT